MDFLNIAEDCSSIEFAKKMDENDPLKHMKDEFLFPTPPSTCAREDVVYLCGNSLGLQPKGTAEQLQIQLKKWSEQGVDAHFEEPTPWLTIDDIVQESMANVVGALPSEVVVMNSLTTNLHLMLSCFYRPTAERHKIITEKRAFPSDTHAVTSQIKYHNLDPATSLVEIAPREGEATLRTEDILSVIREHGDSLALCMLPGVQYSTGQYFDIPRITEETHKVGAFSGWDLAHAVGNVVLKLHEWNCDFACWCTYKYLNSGPGSIGGCFVHENQGNVQQNGDGTLSFRNRFSGWWGHRLDDRFRMDPEFIPIPGAYGFRLSNPPVVCIACVRASLDVFEKAGGMLPLREKSLKLTGYLEFLLKKEIGEHVTIFTPSNPEERGAQLSVVFKTKDFDEVFAKLQAAGVVCDERKPNIMRLSPTPLYNTFCDVFHTVQELKRILCA